MDQIVSHLVFAALPHHDCGRGPVNLSHVMDPVVRHGVALVLILRAGAVAGDEDSNASGMSDLVVDDAVVQAGEIQAQARSARVDQPAGLNCAAPRARKRTSALGESKCSHLCWSSPLVAPFQGKRSLPVSVKPRNTRPVTGLSAGPP